MLEVNRIPLIMVLILLLVLVISGCQQFGEPAAVPKVEKLETSPSLPTITPPRRELPPGWVQLLPYDGIRPIYQPEFITADQADLIPEELIMGVSWEGESKAYPVTVLRHREMVNDEMAGIPYLVSW